MNDYLSTAVAQAMNSEMQAMIMKIMSASNNPRTIGQIQLFMSRKCQEDV